jgi:hypothetical protein
MGLLALVPVKDWLYGGVILAMLAGFGWYTVHERNLGAAHEVAALKASSDRLQQETDKKTTALQTRADMAERAYEKEHLSTGNLPPVQPVRVCIPPTHSDRVVPQTRGQIPGNETVRAAPAGLQQVPTGNTIVAGPDIGGMLDALAASADQVSATLREFQARESFQND